MRDFLGNQLAVGDIVSTVVFRAPGNRLWRMNLARIIGIDDRLDPLTDSCTVEVLDQNKNTIEVTADALLLYSTEYRNAHITYLIDFFKDWNPNR